MFAWDAEPDAAGWFGCGSAFAAADPGGVVRGSDEELPFFTLLVDNLEMTLAKSSLEVAREYLDLVPEELAAASGSSPEIAAEHERTVEAVLAIVGEERLLRAEPRSSAARSGIRNPTSTR